MGNQLGTAIITTHNRKNLLLKTIASVQRQTYAPIELIVVDDASTDGTRELLEVLSKQQGFTYIYIPERESKGVNHARNVGILEAKELYCTSLRFTVKIKIAKHIAIKN